MLGSLLNIQQLLLNHDFNNRVDDAQTASSAKQQVEVNIDLIYFIYLNH
jgi:hypothetical protein